MKNQAITKSNTGQGTQSALQAFNQLVDAWKEYQKTKEIEQTKREQIAALRDCTIKRLDHQRDLLEMYLKETFKERRYVIEGMFERLDQGIANGDNQLVNMAMQSIISTVQTSPLQDVQKIMSQIENDSSNDVIEI